MEKKVETKFSPSDDILKQLVIARREEVVRLQRSQAAQLEDLETRGQARIAALKDSLPKEMAAVLESLDETHNEAQRATASQVESLKVKLEASSCSPQNETAVHPGLAGGQLVAPRDHL
jgi:ABC-type phosphate transport system auxiliary subunit